MASFNLCEGSVFTHQITGGYSFFGGGVDCRDLRHAQIFLLQPFSTGQ